MYGAATTGGGAVTGGGAYCPLGAAAAGRAAASTAAMTKKGNAKRAHMKCPSRSYNACARGVGFAFSQPPLCCVPQIRTRLLIYGRVAVSVGPASVGHRNDRMNAARDHERGKARHFHDRVLSELIADGSTTSNIGKFTLDRPILKASRS